MSHAYATKAPSHYSKGFGPLNQNVVIRNHTFVLLDAPALVDEDYQRSAYGVGFDEWLAIPDGPVAFVKSVQLGMFLRTLYTEMH